MEENEDDPSRIGFYLKGFAEAASGFAASGAPALETIVLLYRRVREGYGFSCMMTGERFAPAADPSLPPEVVAIRPLAMGGALHAGNFLCLCPDAAAAFLQGHLTVGPDLALIADLSRIDPELLERLNPLGRLGLAEGGSLRPDHEALAWHRRRSLGG